MRLIAKGLYQGDISDLNLLREESQRKKFTLTVNVGSTPWVPRGIPSFHVPMTDLVSDDDPQRTLNDWPLVVAVARIAAAETLRGGRVLVTCDAGLSRSVVFCAMVLVVLGEGSMVETHLAPGNRTINVTMLLRVRAPGSDPSYTLWHDAAKALEDHGGLA